MAVKLTESIIDVADQHTTLAYFRAAASGKGKATPVARRRGGVAGRLPLPFGSQKEYNELHQAIAAAPPPFDYAKVRGAPGAVLRSVSLPYAKNKYWQKVIPESSSDSWPSVAWQRLLPLEATLANRISFVSRLGWSFKVSPLPAVWLYPFGWSTTVSLRIVGQHSVADLADVVAHVFRGKAFAATPPFPSDADATPLFLRDLFDRVAAGVRSDAFAGEQTADTTPDDVVAVTTVLAKSGGSPSIDGLSTSEAATLRRLIHPLDPPPDGALDDHVYHLRAGDELEYLLLEDRKRFIWLEHLLRPEERNRDHLRCYHNNTLRALIHAGHLRALIQAADASSKPNARLKEIRDSAVSELAAPRYKNASLVEFLQNVQP
jgi:hypothetical protein